MSVTYEGTIEVNATNFVDAVRQATQRLCNAVDHGDVELKSLVTGFGGTYRFEFVLVDDCDARIAEDEFRNDPNIELEY